ncbi:MAG TPA: hypothetical protein VMT49_06695 [Steroidobacteraceae bacterium]|nr:hypothetical protein [Steroidobacteraceae bacterium]
MTETTPSAAVNRRPVLLLVLLFLAPLGAAFWLYYGSSWRPVQHTNHGTLIPPVTLPEPALPLAAVPPARGPDGPASVFRGKWTLLVTGTGEGGCDVPCRGTLIYARQTWLSLAQLRSRVQRVLLAGPGCCDVGYLQREHAGLIALDASGAVAAPLLQALPGPRENTIYVVDPLGNLMMRYDVRQDPKGLREDLKKLLELSHIG